MTHTSAITVSAPANVMLFGEHAVLHGYQAIVCALSPRIYATISPREDGQFQIVSSLASVTGDVVKINEIKTPELSFVLAAICLFIQSPKTNQATSLVMNKGFNLTIKSEFSHTVGLGSSAAVVAACVYALMLYQKKVQSPLKNVCLDDVFDLGLSVIHAVQNRGSGSDLAASIYGGMVSYQPKPRAIKPLLISDSNDLTNYPNLNLLYCGYKMPTADVIHCVEQSEIEFPEIYSSLYQQMNEVTRLAEAAITDNNWNKLGKLMNIYHGLMDALGVSDEKLSSLIYQSRQKSNVLGAKISGSGLGDCIVTLSKSNNNKLSQSNIDKQTQVAATISPKGLLIHE